MALHGPIIAAAAPVRAGGTAGGADDGGIVGSSSNDSAAGSSTAAASLTGEVLTYDGLPIAGATITFESLDDPPRAIPDIAVVSDADGRFSFNLPPGNFRVTVVSRAGARKSRKAQVVAGKGAHVKVWLPH